MGRDAKKKAQRRAQKPLTVSPGPGRGDRAVNHDTGIDANLSPQEAIRASYPTEKPWNTRYLEYARHEGTESPDAMLRRDEGRFPGGRMVGFILWISARWAEWREKNAKQHDAVLGPAEHDAFDAWLKSYVDEKTRRIIAPLPQAIVRPPR
jgi:hypothetical protein